MADKEITFEIKSSIGVFGESGTSGWKRELNLVSWNSREPKLDLREWSPDHLRMGKGITLTRDEASSLVGLLSRHLSI